MLVYNKLKLRKILSILLFIFAACGLSACSSKAPPAPQPTYFNHTVKFSGETLAVISAWYTGSAKNWELLAAANPELKPTRIKIGDVIKIPNDLITRFEPLPKKLLKALPAKEQQEALSKSESKPDEQPKPVATPEAQPTTTADQTPAPAVATAVTSETAPTNPTVAVITPTPDPADEMVPAFEEDLVIEPTPESNQAAAVATLSPEDKAREDLIDEILRK